MKPCVSFVPVILLFSGLYLVLGFAGAGDVIEQKRQQQAYCKNVNLWKSSGNQLGHPDYNGVYATHCPQTGE